jgi:antitoxin HicB
MVISISSASSTPRCIPKPNAAGSTHKRKLAVLKHRVNHRLWYNPSMKIVEAVTGMTRTYTFVFQPEPEGGYTVTCPALPGLVTYGETLDEARLMARDAMEGLIEIMLEKGERVPESDAADAAPRFHRLANTLQDEGEAEPIFEQLSAKIAAGV